MSSPRKFADKIALIQQKQAEGDVAFRTIICEVGEAKQRINYVPTNNGKSDVASGIYEKSYQKYQGSNVSSNGSHTVDCHYSSHPLKADNGSDSDQLLQIPENPSWRRTNSDPSLHHPMMPPMALPYSNRIDSGSNNQTGNYDMMDVKFESHNQGNHLHHLQVNSSPFQAHQPCDFNHHMNQNYINDRSHPIYPNTPITATASLPSHSPTPSSAANTHAMLGPRYSGGSTGSNVLMLPQPHHSRGGSLPDLRTGNVFHPQQISFSTTPSPPTNTNQHFFRSTSPQDSSDIDRYLMGSHQSQFNSSIGPLKQSPSSRRRPSPLGEMKQSSPRRQNSPSPDVSPNPSTMYRVEPSSPQSQSSYSPQNSPHLLASPGNDHSPFSPQQSGENNGNNQQAYYALPSHLDQITLDHNFFTQQQVSPSPSSTSQQANHHHQHHHSSSPTSAMNSLSNDINDIHLGYFRPTNFYPTFMDNSSLAYSQAQTSVNVNHNASQKSPTIPNIILTDVDSSKLDLSKELANDFSNAFDVLIDGNDLPLNTDDFLLNGTDLSIDSHLCDETFRMEN